MELEPEPVKKTGAIAGKKTERLRNTVRRVKVRVRHLSRPICVQIMDADPLSLYADPGPDPALYLLQI